MGQNCLNKKIPVLTKLTYHKKFHNGPIKFHNKFLSMNLLWFVSFRKNNDGPVIVGNISLWNSMIKKLPVWNILWFVSLPLWNLLWFVSLPLWNLPTSNQILYDRCMVSKFL